MNFCCLADSFQERSQAFGCFKVLKNDRLKRAFLKSGQDRTGLYKCNSKTCSLPANQKPNSQKYKINTIKLIHFKLIADLLVKSFTVIMK